MPGKDLNGKVAIVTGAAQGIGLASARRLAEAGASVCIVDINEEGIRKAADDIVANGGTATAFVCDVSELSDVKSVIDGVLKQYGQIDIMVNNAAVTHPFVPLQELTNQDWDRTIAVDLTSVFYCCREVIPYMIKRNTGRIINFSSVAGKHANANMTAYSAAKAGVIAFTKALAKEVAQYNILANAITPGPIDTPIQSYLTREQLEAFSKTVPLGRMGKPEEVAAMVHWLASDDISFSTGAVFDISGGRATH
jgi:3-oxoacyl-[acyl-carrier protein] reductase